MTTIVVTTAASVTKLVDDVPKILANNVLNSVIGNADISKTILSSNMYGFSYAAGTKYYNFGRDSYLNGLPVSHTIRELPESVDLDSLVHDALNIEEHYKFPQPEPEEGEPIADLINSVSYSKLTYPDTLWLLVFFLQENSDWDMESIGGDYNEFTQISTGNEYQFQGLWATFSQGNLHVKLQPTNANPTIPVLELNIPYNFNEFTLIIQSRYVSSNDPNREKIWLYPPASNLYPFLSFGLSELNSSNFMPIVPIRLNNSNIIDSNDHEELTKSATNLLSRININLREFSDNLTDPEDPTAINSVDEAYIMFAANLDSDEPIAIQYIYEFFKSLYYTQNKDQQEWIDTTTALGPDLSINIGSRNSLSIKDKLRDGGIDVRIWFNFISLEIKTGLIGDPQPAYDPLILRPYLSDVDMNNANASDISKSFVVGSEWSGVFVGETYSYNTHQFILRKQIASNTFVELVVHGLQHDMLIDERAGKINTNITDISQGKFFIPISKGIIDQFNAANQSYLYYETLILLAYAVDVQKLDWYQDPNFWSFVGIVLLFFGVDVSAIAAAIQGGIQTTVAYLAEAFIINALVQETIKQVIDLVGADVALILAAIAAGYALYQGKGTQIAEFLDAETLLNYATLSIEAINTNIKEDFLDLEQEQEAFLKDVEELQDEIDAANDLLSSAGEVDIYTLLNANMYTDYTETPEEFYNRSIHMSNPGVLTLDVVENFVGNALALPKAQTN